MREPKITMCWGIIARWLALRFDLNRVQKYRGNDHHQYPAETERDLHRNRIRDFEQRHVASEREQDAEAVDWQRIRPTAHRKAHHRCD
jgi:hypothetical protein